MEEFDLYPPKPVIEKVKVEGNWGLTFFSMVLFFGTFLFIFKDQISFVLFLIMVLFIHEMGHFILMKVFKYDNVRMLFIPLMGAFVQGNKEKYSQRESFFVISAGPFPGVLIGSLLLVFATIYRQEWMLQLSFLFLFLNVINLLPIDPIDGGQLFKLFVNRKRDLFLMVFALISSLAMIVVGWFIDSYVILVFGFLMGFKVRSFQRNYHLRSILDGKGVRYESTYDDLTNEEYAKIKEVLIEETPALRKYLSMSDENNDDLLASHVNATLLAPVRRDAGRLLKFCIVVLWLLSISLPVYLLTSDLLDYSWYFEKL
ncbi:MAG: site-2 protease family protein [Crocinitomicaceae bacterium]